MTRAELEHAVRAVCDVTRLSEVIVIGSQSILGPFPDAPPRLRQSMEVDLVLPDAATADVVEGALGEESSFHRLHGFYAQGLTADDPTIPTGWRDRLVLVRNANTRDCSGWCLDPHDLAASKLAAFRDKDRDFIRGMLIERLIEPGELRARVEALPCDDVLRARLLAWVAGTLRDLRLPES